MAAKVDVTMKLRKPRIPKPFSPSYPILAILSKLRHRKAANPVLYEVMMMVWMRSASPPVASQVKSSPFFTFSIGTVFATTSGFQTLLGLFD